MLLLANIFQPLMTVFETVLKFFHNSWGIEWGWAIVLLTVCIRAILIPLTVKQYHSMRALQKLAPQMKEIQQKYKDDKQRQQQEMMRLYRENNVNPFASCLPLVLQLPVIISLYYMLEKSLRRDICPAIQRTYQHAYALKHHVSVHAAAGHTTACGTHAASFLFIPDLTSRAHGAVLIGLILLYITTQLGSTVLMSSPQVDKNQQRMMMIVPLFFVFFVISFPTGVIVYWITTNLWTIIQQYVIRRRIGAPAMAVATAGAGGATAPARAAASGNGGGRGSGLWPRLRGREPSRGAAAGGSAEGAQAGTGGSAERRARSRAATGTRAAAKPPAKGSARTSGAKGNGSAAEGAAGGLGGIVGGLRKRREEPAEKVATPARGGPPPPPPRKKKKRSGRRR